MPIIARAPEGREFLPAPTGTHNAVCADVVDLGIVEGSYGGKPTRAHKIRLIWQIDETLPDANERFTVSQLYTLSLHEKAKLRHDLESWRGRPFTEAELKGFDVEAVIGIPCQVNVVQRKSAQGKVYANVAAVMPLGKGMQRIYVKDYVRVQDRAREEPEDAVEAPDDEVPF